MRKRYDQLLETYLAAQQAAAAASSTAAAAATAAKVELSLMSVWCAAPGQHGGGSGSSGSGPSGFPWVIGDRLHRLTASEEAVQLKGPHAGVPSLYQASRCAITPSGMQVCHHSIRHAGVT